ncbi:hypothetical protein V2J09_011536 [Rumex salicifolius]
MRNKRVNFVFSLKFGCLLASSRERTRRYLAHRLQTHRLCCRRLPCRLKHLSLTAESCRRSHRLRRIPLRSELREATAWYRRGGDSFQASNLFFEFRFLQGFKHIVDYSPLHCFTYLSIKPEVISDTHQNNHILNSGGCLGEDKKPSGEKYSLQFTKVEPRQHPCELILKVGGNCMESLALYVNKKFLRMTSHFIKTVSLKDWWLIKADNNSSGNTVAIGGTESAGQPALRVFCSAPIVKRLDLFTLKTADGIFVLLKGLINKQQTYDNGFSEERGIGSEDIADADLNPERSFEDARSDAQNQKEASHATANCQGRDTCMNKNSYKSEVGSMRGVRYNLRHREVPNSEAEGIFRSKHVKNIGKGKSSVEKNMMKNGTSKPPLSSLENSQTPGITPIHGKSSKDANNAKNVTMSIPGEVSIVGNSMQKINGARISQRHDAVGSISKDAGKCKNLISDDSPAGKPSQSKKRKMNESTAQKSTIITRSLRKKNVENNIENHNGRNEDENKLTPRPGQLRSARVNIKRKCTRKDCTTLEINNNLSPQTTEKLENSTLRDCFSEKSLRSKNEGRKKSNLTRTTVDKNCHDSAKPAVRSCNSKARCQPKVAVSERERKAIRSSTPVLLAQEMISSPKGEIKNSASQGSVLRTSRSGRLLLPIMEFWRNQIPVYDADRGISAIRDGSTILKVKARKGTKSCAKERRLLSWS